jgi:hypothetical protein
MRAARAERQRAQEQRRRASAHFERSTAATAARRARAQCARAPRHAATGSGCHTRVVPPFSAALRACVRACRALFCLSSSAHRALDRPHAHTTHTTGGERQAGGQRFTQNASAPRPLLLRVCDGGAAGTAAGGDAARRRPRLIRHAPLLPRRGSAGVVAAAAPPPHGRPPRPPLSLSLSRAARAHVCVSRQPGSRQLPAGTRFPSAQPVPPRVTHQVIQQEIRSDVIAQPRAAQVAKPIAAHAV